MLPEFRELVGYLRTDTSVDRVSVAQFSTAWMSQTAAIALREELDDLLLGLLLRGRRDLMVRRVVLYDLPGRRQPGSPDAAHRAWTDRLRRDVAYVRSDGAESSPAGPGSPQLTLFAPRISYEIRQLVLGGRGARRRPPREVAAIGDPGPRFDELWGLVDLFPLTAGETRLVAPYGDYDPRYYLDLEVDDFDRLQPGTSRRGRVDRRRAGG